MIPKTPGAVEVWGRGTNRVIAMCRKHGAVAPSFQERQGFLIVTFKAQLVADGEAGASRSEAGHQVTAEVTAQIASLCREPKSAKEIMAVLKAQGRTT